jgi:hypothetical protein
VVTLNALQVAVFNHYAIATKGKPGPQAKDINGGFMDIEAQVEKQGKNNVEQLIQEKINQAMKDMQIKAEQGNLTLWTLWTFWTSAYHMLVAAAECTLETTILEGPQK